jgi:hypothetical protein
VSQEAMETNVVTSLGNPHIPSMHVTIGSVLPPNQPSLFWATMVSTASTLGNGLILSMVAFTAPFTQSVTGPLFSYGMPNFDTKSILSYSNKQTLGLIVGSSNAPLQGSMGGTSSPYNAFPYGGGYIPPSSPSLDDDHHHSVGLNVNYSSFGEGSQVIPSYSMLVGSTLFSLFDVFGKNKIMPAAISAGGNPKYGKQHPVQGIIPA